MIRINIQDAKTHLSRYLPDIERGETILLCRRNVPIAQIGPLPAGGERDEPRPFGLERGRLQVPDDFLAPMPEAELAHFYDAPLAVTAAMHERPRTEPLSARERPRAEPPTPPGRSPSTRGRRAPKKRG